MSEVVLAVSLMWGSAWTLNIDDSRRYRAHSICIGDVASPGKEPTCTLEGYMEEKKRLGFFFFPKNWYRTEGFINTCDFSSIEHSGSRPDLGTRIECGFIDDVPRPYWFLRHRNAEIRYSQ